MASSRAPASVIAMREYSGRPFVHDAVAGVTVGLAVLPLAMAFAIASALTPQSGIYCAIVTGFIISALAGSKYQIGGPNRSVRRRDRRHRRGARRERPVSCAR